MNKSEQAKQKLTHLIREFGFTELISGIGELAKEEELIIESKNNSTLSFCFEAAFLLLMDVYPKNSKKGQKFIRQVLTGQSFQEGLDLIKWDSPMQSEAMKKAHELICSWEEADK